MSNAMTFKRHRPVDRSDPGFSIPGCRLRWISAKVSEHDPGRPWRIIRKSDLTADLVKHLEGINPEAFMHGDTIRRGDLVLAHTTEDRAKDLRKELQELSRNNEKSVNRLTHGIKNPDGSSRAKVEVNEDSDVTQQMIAKFKSSNTD